MVQEKNPLIQLKKTDVVFFSSNTIPGNEKSVNGLINDLIKKGVSVETGNDIHTSGHGYQEELKLMLGMLKPKYFMPVHGEYRMLKKHAEMAVKMGVKEENIFICAIGDVLEIDGNCAEITDKVKSGSVLVDQSGLGDVEFNVMKDRDRMATHGVVVIQIKKNHQRYKTRLTLKGVVADYDRKILFKEVNNTVEDIMKKNENNSQSSKRELYKELGVVLDSHLNRKPLIILAFD
jgi:ribonuclease J